MLKKMGKDHSEDGDVELEAIKKYADKKRYNKNHRIHKTGQYFKHCFTAKLVSGAKLRISGEMPS
jgi:hypothetical protein